MTATSLTTTCPCPCGSAAEFGACCHPVIQGDQPAKTAEQLMRSRYSAHVCQAVDYLLDSWKAPSADIQDRDAVAGWASQSHWCQLNIHNCRKGQPGDTEGWVEFSAYYFAASDPRQLQQHWELSYFVQQDGHWFYVSGEVRDNPPAPGRNDACPCGSGKKYKRCCYMQ